MKKLRKASSAKRYSEDIWLIITGVDSYIKSEESQKGRVAKHKDIKDKKTKIQQGENKKKVII